MNTIYFGKLSKSAYFAWSDKGIVAASNHSKEEFLNNLSKLGSANFEEVLSPPPNLQSQTLKAYEANTNSVKCDLSLLKDFQRQVLTVVAQIPPGRPLTYGQVAAMVGRPGASRAVGSALAKNPLPHIIPCHRVIRSDGKVGHYSDGGSEVKARLLAREKTQ